MSGVKEERSISLLLRLDLEFLESTPKTLINSLHATARTFDTPSYWTLTVERRERSHRLIVKGAEFEKVFPLSRDLEQEDVQDMMNQLQNSSYNKSIVRQAHIAALHKDQQQIAEAVKKTEKGDDS